MFRHYLLIRIISRTTEGRLGLKLKTTTFNRNMKLRTNQGAKYVDKEHEDQRHRLGTKTITFISNAKYWNTNKTCVEKEHTIGKLVQE